MCRTKYENRGMTFLVEGVQFPYFPFRLHCVQFLFYLSVEDEIRMWFWWNIDFLTEHTMIEGFFPNWQISRWFIAGSYLIRPIIVGEKI